MPAASLPQTDMPGSATQPGGMEPSTAPIYNVPQERVVSIEHPCIVRNFDNGIKSLGGEPQMKHVSGVDVSRSLLTIDSADSSARLSNIVWAIVC